MGNEEGRKVRRVDGKEKENIIGSGHRKLRTATREGIGANETGHMSTVEGGGGPPPSATDIRDYTNRRSRGGGERRITDGRDGTSYYGDGV